MHEAATDLPEWISPPGAIILRLMRERAIELDDLAESAGLTLKHARGLIEGLTPIDQTIAGGLASLFGSTERFWLESENVYRSDLDRNLPLSIDQPAKDWMRTLPLRDMVRRGWLQHHEDIDTQVIECFEFFGVFSVHEWKERYQHQLKGTNFRTSLAFSADPPATAAWLRRAESAAYEIECSPWSPSKLHSSLNAIRRLSRIHQPERFVPALKQLCADAGVALVIVPAPSGCRASGAAKKLSQRKAMIALSFRYYSDDHFWFSLLHEIGHLLYHADRRLFLETEDGETDDIENEANTFAAETLIPRNQRSAIAALPASHKTYIRFARNLEIAPGIVVGQMQKSGKLAFNWLNALKRRFDWDRLYAESIIP